MKIKNNKMLFNSRDRVIIIPLIFNNMERQKRMLHFSFYDSITIERDRSRY